MLSIKIDYKIYFVSGTEEHLVWTYWTWFDHFVVEKENNVVANKHSWGCVILILQNVKQA